MPRNSSRVVHNYKKALIIKLRNIEKENTKITIAVTDSLENLDAMLLTAPDDVWVPIRAVILVLAAAVDINTKNKPYLFSTGEIRAAKERLNANDFRPTSMLNPLEKQNKGILVEDMRIASSLLHYHSSPSCGEQRRRGFLDNFLHILLSFFLFVKDSFQKLTTTKKNQRNFQEKEEFQVYPCHLFLLSVFFLFAFQTRWKTQHLIL